MSAASEVPEPQEDQQRGDAETEESQPKASSAATIQKIQDLLKGKGDTSKFVGLALLKSVLDNTAEVRQNEETILLLWEAVPARFLDRLLRTGFSRNAPAKDAREMLNLAIAVIHTFTVLLPGEKASDPRLVGRIPLLVASLLQW